MKMNVVFFFFCVCVFLQTNYFILIPNTQNEDKLPSGNNKKKP